MPNTLDPSNAIPTTLQESVNIVLSVLGEAPVNSLTGTTASLGLNIIEEVSTDIQSKGWWFNQQTSNAYDSTANIVIYPSNTSSNWHNSIPEEARRYITIRSARIAHSRLIGTEENFKFTYQEELVSLAILQQAHVRNAGSELTFSSYPSELKGLGIDEFIFLSGNVEDKLGNLKLATEIKTQAKIEEETDLLEAQALTEGSKQSNLDADSTLKGKQGSLIDTQALTEGAKKTDIEADTTLKGKQGSLIDAQVTTEGVKATDIGADTTLKGKQGSLIDAQAQTEGSKKTDIEADTTLKGKQGSLIDAQVTTEGVKATDIGADTTLKGKQGSLIDAQASTETSKKLDIEADTSLKTKQGLLVDAQATDVAADTNLKGKQGTLIDAQAQTEGSKKTDIEADTTLKGKQGSLIDAQAQTEGSRKTDIEADSTLKGKQGSLIDAQVTTEGVKATDIGADTTLKGKQGSLIDAQAQTEGSKKTDIEADTTLKGKQGALIDAQELKTDAETTLTTKQGLLVDAQELKTDAETAKLQIEKDVIEVQKLKTIQETVLTAEQTKKLSSETNLVTAQEQKVQEEIDLLQAQDLKVQEETDLLQQQFLTEVQETSKRTAEKIDIEANTTLKGKQGNLIDAQVTTEGVKATDIGADTTLKGKQGTLIDAQVTLTADQEAKTVAEKELIESQKTKLDEETTYMVTEEKNFNTNGGINIGGLFKSYKDYRAELRIMGYQETQFNALPAYKKKEALTDAADLRSSTVSYSTAGQLFDSVNNVLELIGEIPVADCGDNLLATKAKRLLEKTDTELQARGWWFNTETDVEVSASITNVIPWDSDWLNIEIHDIPTTKQKHGTDELVRNLKTKSYNDWSGTHKATIIYKRNLDVTPQKYIELLEVRVARLLTELYPQSGIDVQRLPKMEAELNAYFKDRENDQGNYSVFDNYDAAIRVGINRSYNLF